MKEYKVKKTLVVGLGSTGTAIVDALKERIDWELGPGRAPWVRFLAIETNSSFKLNIPVEDFRALTLTAQEFSQLRDYPEIYDDQIALSKWIDHDNLKVFSSGSVGDGAGHIRMIGRLALLYPKNFQMIRNALEERINYLRGLQEGEINQTINQGVSSYEEVKVQMAESSVLRIFVVGTLAGGTCSGTAGDLGIMLRSLVKGQDNDNVPREHVIGAFTIPHSDHNDSVPNSGQRADQHKANSYHALVELNQYQNFHDPDRFATIRYPGYGDKPPLDAAEQPYNYILLARPVDTSEEAQRNVVQLIADRIFMNAFVEEADLGANAINTPPPPKDGLSFSFATFGLSSIEYPIRRLITAAKLQLIHTAINHWLQVDNPDLDLQRVINTELRLTPEALLTDLLRDGSGGSSRSELTAARNKAVSASTADARESAIREWRSGFEATGDGFKGRITQLFTSNQSGAIGSFNERLLAVVNTHFADYHSGPDTLIKIFEAAQVQLNELRKWTPNQASKTPVDDFTEQFRLADNNDLLRYFGLQTRVKKGMRQGFGKVLEQEENNRLNYKLYEILKDGPKGPSFEPGLITRMERALAEVVSRFKNLRSRISSFSAAAQKAYAQLEGSGGKSFPGILLYKTGAVGTVNTELGAVLDEPQKEKLYKEIIQSWTPLGTELVYPKTDWLKQPVKDTEDPLPPEWVKPLEDVVFERIQPLRSSGKDLVDRLLETPNWEGKVKDAAGMTSPLLGLSKDLAQHSDDYRVGFRRMVMWKRSSEELKKALHTWRTSTSEGAKEVEINDPFRLVLFEEYYQFSLRGVSEVETYSKSTPQAIPMLFTRSRNDIDWTPLSVNERRQLRETERLLVLAALHGVVKVDKGALVFEVPQDLGVSTTERSLPLRLPRAARVLAAAKKDTRNRPLTNASSILRARLESTINSMIKELGEVGYVKHISEQIHVGLINQMPSLDGKGMGLDRRTVAMDFMQWHQDNQDIRTAYLQAFQPDQVVIDRLWREQGESKPKGGTFKEAGYYCTVCGAPVGGTLEEAMANGFKCQYYPNEPKHPFGDVYDPFQGMFGASPKH